MRSLTDKKGEQFAYLENNILYDMEGVATGSLEGDFIVDLVGKRCLAGRRATAFIHETAPSRLAFWAAIMPPVITSIENSFNTKAQRNKGTKIFPLFLSSSLFLCNKTDLRRKI